MCLYEKCTTHSFTMSPICTIVFLALVGTSLAAYNTVFDVTDIRFRPWQGSINKRFAFVCGCALISPEWAVTAASCVQSPPYDVRFGSIERTEGKIRTVEEIIVHENYSTSGSYKYNNIAVLKFAPLKLSFTKNSIKLGETEAEEYNDNCYFTGWGVTRSSDTDYPLVLHQGTMKIIQNMDCAKHPWSNIDGSHVCTGDQYSARTCRGDTGGPLVCYKGDQYELVGISSWQYFGCDDYYPVYTRVSYFRQWIEDKTGV